MINQSHPEQNKKFDVGGQAVMEGVMMRSPNATAVTVRRPDGTMEWLTNPPTAAPILWNPDRSSPEICVAVNPTRTPP